MRISSGLSMTWPGATIIAIALFCVFVGCDRKRDGQTESGQAGEAEDKEVQMCREVFLALRQGAAAPASPVSMEFPKNTKNLKVVQKEQWKDYEVITYSEDESGVIEGDLLEIKKGGKRVFVWEDHKIGIGRVWGSTKEREALIVPLGTNVTGDGKPNLVVHSYSGGNHCCWTLLIFEIGETFRPVAKFDGQDSCPAFEDLDHDGSLAVVMRDMSYAYVFECYAGSPAPTIVFRYKNGQYHLAPDLMRREPPTASQLEQKAKDLKAIFLLAEEMERRKGSDDFFLGEFSMGYTTHGLLAAIAADGIEIPKTTTEIESLNLLLKTNKLHEKYKNIPMNFSEPQMVRDLMRRASSLTEKERIRLNRFVLQEVHQQKCPALGDKWEAEEQLEDRPKSYPGWGPASGLWGEMLKLIYTGNENIAWKFFEEVWPENYPGKKEALAQFKMQLVSSPYDPRSYWAAAGNR